MQTSKIIKCQNDCRNNIPTIKALSELHHIELLIIFQIEMIS